MSSSVDPALPVQRSPQTCQIRATVHNKPYVLNRIVSVFHRRSLTIHRLSANLTGHSTARPGAVQDVGHVSVVVAAGDVGRCIAELQRMACVLDVVPDADAGGGHRGMLDSVDTAVCDWSAALPQADGNP